MHRLRVNGLVGLRTKASADLDEEANAATPSGWNAGGFESRTAHFQDLFAPDHGAGSVSRHAS
jgi:hypothetical protein